MKILDNAEVRELYAAGDYSHTRELTVEVRGGKVRSFIESRGKGGTAQNVTLRLSDPKLMPEIVSLADTAVIRGVKHLELEGGTTPTDDVWDEVILLTPPETTAITECASTTVTETQAAEESREEPQAEKADGILPLIVIVSAASAIIAIAVGILVKQNVKNNATPKAENKNK